MDSILKLKGLLILLLIFCFSGTIYPQYAEKEKFRLGETYEKGGDLEGAARIYEELYMQRPDSEKYFEALSRTYIQLNKYQELLELTEERLKKFKSYKLYASYGEYLWRTGDNLKANDAWNEALRLFPDSLNAYAEVAVAQTKVRQIDKAIASLKKAREWFNAPTLFSKDLSELYIASGDYQNGTQEVLSYFYETRDLNYAQGRLYAFMVDPKAGQYIMIRLEEEASKNSHNILVQKLYAFFLRSVGNYDRAFDVVLRIEELNRTEGREILYFADLSRKDGQYDIAIKAYKFIISNANSRRYISTAYYGLARTLEKKILEGSKFSEDEVRDIISKYRDIIEQFPNQPNAADSRFRIALLAFEYLGDRDLAVEELEIILKEFLNLPLAGKASNYLGIIYLTEDDFKKAEEYFSNIRTNRIRSSTAEDREWAEYNMALLIYFSGEIDSAIVLFKGISNKSKSNVANDALDKFIVLERNKELTKALGLFAKAEFEEWKNSLDKAYDLYIETSEISTGENLSELSMLRASKIKMRLADYENTRLLLKKLIESNPESIYSDHAYILIGDSYKEQSNNEEAIRYYTVILTKYPNSIYSKEARDKIRELRSQKI